jgi:hypothetical protein
LASNLGGYGGKQATNRLTYGTFKIKESKNATGYFTSAVSSNLCTTAMLSL